MGVYKIMNIIVEGDIVDYIDENELKSDIRSQIKNEVSNMLKNDKEVKEIIIKEIINEIKDIQFTESIKEALREKIEQIIKEKYLNNKDTWDMEYAIGLSDKIKLLYEESKCTFDPILYNAVYNAIQNYKPDDYEISKFGMNLISQDEESINKLKQIFIDRLDEIIEKI